jgi:hypothetical protein
MNATRFAVFGIFLILSVSLVSAVKVEFIEGNGCPFDESEYDVVIDINERLFSSGKHPNPVSADYPVSLEAGTYEIALYAEDGYAARESVFQPNEQFFAGFFNGGGEVARTGATPDLDDYVAYDDKTRIETAFLIPENVTIMKAIHYKVDEIPTDSYNSVQAVCVGIKKLDDPIVPEFGTIVGLVTLIGALGMFFAVRR